MNNSILGAVFTGGRRKASQESYFVAPKLISEMTSVCEVIFSGVNLTRTFMGKESSNKNNNCSLLQCFEELLSRQHARKISKIVLDGVATDTIFDVETFCKKFLNRLVQIEEFTIQKCQPMFIDKMFFTLTSGKKNAKTDAYGQQDRGLEQI